MPTEYVPVIIHPKKGTVALYLNSDMFDILFGLYGQIISTTLRENLKYKSLLTTDKQQAANFYGNNANEVASCINTWLEQDWNNKHPIIDFARN